MMDKLYVLTVYNDGILESCDIFTNPDDALCSGEYYCGAMNIRNMPTVYDPSMSGWVITDERPYFISVVERPILSEVKMHINPRHTFTNSVSPYNKFSYPYGLLSPIYFKNDSLPLVFEHKVQPAIQQAAPVVPPPVPVDDPEQPTLPGGFNYNDMPFTVQDVTLDPYYVKDVHELTHNQQWALVLARVRKRPNIIWGTFTHDEIVQAVQEKTVDGHGLVDMDLKDLQFFYDRARRTKDDSSEEQYEESSSSSEEETEDSDL